MLYGKDMKEFIYFLFWLVVNRSKQQSIQEVGLQFKVNASFVFLVGMVGVPIYAYDISNGRRTHNVNL